MKDYTATLTLEPSDNAPKTLPEISTVRVGDSMRLDAGQRLRIDVGLIREGGDDYVVTPETCESWAEAAYHAHRLSDGRKRALAILRARFFDFLAGSSPSTYYANERGIDVAGFLRYSRGRGESAAIVNGLKGLAVDGLVEIRHFDGDSDYGQACSQTVKGVTVRALQYALALAWFKRPVGKISAAAPIDSVVEKLTPKTVDALVFMVGWITKRFGSANTHRRMYVPAPSRATASTFTALEKRGFVRWVDKAKGDSWESPKWYFEIPTGSRMFEIAASVSAEAAEALLVEDED